MARILVQTNDYRTVLDEADVELADITRPDADHGLLARLEHAVRDAETRRRRPRTGVRHLASIVPVSDYRDVRG